MKAHLHVLSVGSANECNIVRDILLERQQCRLVAVASDREIIDIPAIAHFNVAILHSSLSLKQAQGAGARIRRRWPEAKILVVTRTPADLDDPLYDEWISSILPHTILPLLERLADESEQTKIARTMHVHQPPNRTQYK